MYFTVIPTRNLFLVWQNFNNPYKINIIDYIGNIIDIIQTKIIKKYIFKEIVFVLSRVSQEYSTKHYA